MRLRSIRWLIEDVSAMCDCAVWLRDNGLRAVPTWGRRGSVWVIVGRR
jgi:hypothetical protein